MTKAELEAEIKHLRKERDLLWEACITLKKGSGETIAKGNSTNPAWVFDVTGQAITKIEFMRDHRNE